MSSRVLRKLHCENELEVKDADLSDIESEGGNNNSSRGKQMSINRYDLLHQQSPSESEVKEDDNETEHASAASKAHACEQMKKKKKKKKGGKHTNYRKSSEDNADIDDLKREVDKMYGETYHIPATSGGSVTSNNSTVKNLLSVQNKNLNPSYEMKKMFGSRVVKAEQNKRRNPRGQRPIKSTWLVNPKENWPVVGKTGIFMTIAQGPEIPSSSKADDRNVIYFQFEHTPSYRQIEHKFLTAVESMESDNMVQIINQHPYHIDTLIQLSEICKMSEDYAMASELIEHALLALESSGHTLFNVTSGVCRFDYKRQENRAFFITLFKHAQYLESRAFSRTALEISKLLLSLDPINDPLAMILVIDFYAIRAKQYEWLIQIYNEWETSNNLSQLPNMAYSYALALFYLNKDDTTEADKAIQYALLMFPSILKLLLNELSIEIDSRVKNHNYFGENSIKSQSIGLEQLTSLYACRAKIIWRDADILPWLEINVNAVLDIVDRKDSIVNEYSTKRSQRYLSPPRPILRHIILSDFKEKVPLAQFLSKEEPILMYDPLPPTDSINIYERPNLVPPRIILDGSPFSMFFQSILPTFNVQGGGAAGIADIGGGVQAVAGVNLNAARNPRPIEQFEENDGAVAAIDIERAGVESYAEIRNSLNSIIDAMRDFLENIRPNDADVDDNDSSDDGPNDNLG